MAPGRACRHYLAIACIFKDEAPYLPEWIEFHRGCGVEHFFLYDNASTDNSVEVLEPWTRAGIVTIIDWRIPFRQKAQRQAYQHCLETFGPSARWLAFIDVDEFLFPVDRPLLPAVLADYESHPGVVVNWQVYGSATADRRPAGLVIESYLHRARTQWVRNRRVKSIVDPSRTATATGPHLFIYRDDALAVTENGEPVRMVEHERRVRGIWRLLRRMPFLSIDPYAMREITAREVSVRRLRINHYAVKSREEFEGKWKDRKRTPAEKAAYFRFHDRNEVFDPVLLDLAPVTRQRLAALEETAVPAAAAGRSRNEELGRGPD